MNKFYSSLIINGKYFPTIHQVFRPRYNKEYFKRLTAKIDLLEAQIGQRSSDQHDPNLSRDKLELIKQESSKLVSLKDRYDKLSTKCSETKEEALDEKTTTMLLELESQAAQIEDLIMPTVISIPNRSSKLVPPEDIIIEEIKSDFLDKQNLTKKLSHRKLSYINNCYSKSVVGPNSHYYLNIGAKLQHALSDYFVSELEREDFIAYSGLCMVKSAVVEAANSRESREYSSDPCRVLTQSQRFTTSHLTEASRESLIGFITTLGHINSNNPVRLVANGAGYRPGSEWFDGDDSRVTQFETVHALVLNSSIESYSMKEYDKVIKIIWNTYKKLELPTRLVHCSLDSMFSHEYDAHRIDIWLPSQREWIQVGRISHYLDYISIRAGMKRGHFIDASVFDSQSLVAAIIENRQTSMGKFIIPEPIQAHMPSMDDQELGNYTLATNSSGIATSTAGVMQNYEQRRYFNKKKLLFGHSEEAKRRFRSNNYYIDLRWCFAFFMFVGLMTDWEEVWRTYLNNWMRKFLYDYVKRPVTRLWWSLTYKERHQWPQDLSWDEVYERQKEFYLSSPGAIAKQRYYSVSSGEPPKV